MREGRDSVDRNSSRTDFRQFNEQGLPIRDNATASKFQWKNLLNESRNSMFDGEERGIQGNYVGNHDELVENLTSVRGEMIRNSPNYACNGGNAGYRGSSRNFTGGSVEDPNFRGRARDMIDLRGENAGYHRRGSCMTGSPIDNADYNGSLKNMNDYSVEDGEYRGPSRTLMVEIPVKDDAYRRCSRTIMNVHSVEDTNYPRHTRRMSSSLVEDGARMLTRESPRHIGRDSSIKSYQEDDYRFRNEDSSHSLTPRSQSNGQHTFIRRIPLPTSDAPQQEVFHHAADGLGIGGSISPINCYSSHEILLSKAGTNPLTASNDVGTRLRAEYRHNLSRHVDHTHPEIQSSGMVCRRYMSEGIHAQYENVHDYHNHVDPFGNDSLDPAFPRQDYLGSSHRSNLHNYGHTVQEEPIMVMDDVSRIGRHKVEYGAISMHPMDVHFENETEAGYETQFHDELLYCENSLPGVSHKDNAWIYPTCEEEGLSLHEDAQKVLQSGDKIDFQDQLKRVSKRKCRFMGKTSLPKRRTSTLGGRISLSGDTRHLTDEPESELFYPSRSSRHHFDSKANAGMSKTEPRLPFGGLSKELQSRLSKPHESGSNNVKNRLNPRFVPRLFGPQASKLMVENVKNCAKSSLIVNHATSAPQTNGKTKRISVKKRLKATPPTDVCLPDPQVSHRGLNIESEQKLASKNSSTTKETGVLLEADPDHSILKVKPTEKDPPDNSEELRCQVNHWFSTCMLYLYANPGRHKKFKDQGKAGNLKCIICSSSKEFVQTKDIATHAFTSLKVGLRAPHLGFHRALCVLMGWDPDLSSNGRWIGKALPDVEARALKEDLILWPPVVVIHNGSVGDFYNNELVKISVEQLENTLRDMGLSLGKATICHGKPGNPNIFLVKFNGTLSSLQEAERFEKVFSEKKRGRANLQEINARAGCSERVVQEADGLQEAERIDKIFPEKKCGKVNLQKVDAGFGCSEIIVQEADNKIEDTCSGMQESERLDKVLSEKKCVRENLQEVHAGVGCNKRVVQEADSKIEDPLSGLQEAGRLGKVFSEKKREKENLQEVDARVGCSESGFQEADHMVEDTLSGLQDVERPDKDFSEKKCGRQNLQEVDAGIGCSKSVVQEADNKKEEGLQEAEGHDKIFSEKKHGTTNLQEVDAGVGCSESLVQEGDNKIEQTLSVVQESERLDNVFPEKKHGKANLQQVFAGVGCTEKVVQQADNKIEDTLYGYLGIAEDLDKLSFELRRRVVGKSKKEILACVDTST